MSGAQIPSIAELAAGATACVALGACAVVQGLGRNGRDAAWSVVALVAVACAFIAFWPPEEEGWPVVVLAVALALALRDAAAFEGAKRLLASVAVVAELTVVLLRWS